MSAEPLSQHSPAAPRLPQTPRALPWALFRRQVAAILRLELKKSFLGRRALGLYVLAAIPVAILALRTVLPVIDDRSDLGTAATDFAGLYQFILRGILYFGCVSIFGNLIRREMLDRTLHFYFLTPVRREVLVTAKFLTGLLVACTLFGASTAGSFFFGYLPFRGLDRFFLHGPGIGHLLAYLGVTFLGCLGYGAVFLCVAFFVKSPAIPAVFLLGWESLNAFLPPLLKKISIIYYLEAFTPVPLPTGPLALLAGAPSAWVAIPGLLLLTAVLLVISAWKVRRMEISYEED
jgi:ABC-type transport system involved in multi-copper enzyme maturation permease subunit